MLGLGIPGGAYGGNKGGSSVRESKLIYDANLFIERQVICEPLYAVRDFNRKVGGMSEWEDDIVFRVRDVQLTTLNQNTGMQKIVG